MSIEPGCLRVPELHASPGHLLRRALQLHNAAWAERVSATITSPQYAVLLALHEHDDWDQRSVGEWVALDKSTGADVIGRLVGRGLVRRRRDDRDRRRNVLELTPEGDRLFEELTPKVLALSEYLLSRFTPADTATLTALLGRFVF